MLLWAHMKIHFGLGKNLLCFMGGRPMYKRWENKLSRKVQINSKKLLKTWMYK
jgi:hypothetical protein